MYKYIYVYIFSIWKNIPNFLAGVFCCPWPWYTTSNQTLSLCIKFLPIGRLDANILNYSPWYTAIFPRIRGDASWSNLYIYVCVCVSECSVSIVHFRNSRLMTFKKHMVDITSLVPYVWKRRIKLSGANYMNSPTWVTQTHISSIYRNEQILPPHLSKKHPWGH